eukprot:1161488-Pelagomonas_calceolata.AAC.2
MPSTHVLASWAQDRELHLSAYLHVIAPHLCACPIHASPAPVCMQAEQKIVNSAGNKEYLPIDGLPEFKKATVDLLLGADHPAIKELAHLLQGDHRERCNACQMMCMCCIEATVCGSAAGRRPPSHQGVGHRTKDTTHMHTRTYMYTLVLMKLVGCTRMCVFGSSCMTAFWKGLVSFLQAQVRVSNTFSVRMQADERA